MKYLISILFFITVISSLQAQSIYKAVLKGDVSLLKQLIAEGKDVNEKVDGRTPLEAAILRDLHSCAEIIMQNGGYAGSRGQHNMDCMWTYKYDENDNLQIFGGCPEEASEKERNFHLEIAKCAINDVQKQQKLINGFVQSRGHYDGSWSGAIVHEYNGVNVKSRILQSKCDPSSIRWQGPYLLKLDLMLTRDGDEISKREKCDQVIKAANQVIDMYPYGEMSEAFHARGMGYFCKGMNEEAIADYDKAIQLDSNFASAYLDRGLCFEQQSNYDEALSDYSATIDIMSDQKKYHHRSYHDYYVETAYLQRGKVYQIKGMDKEALSDYARVGYNFSIITSGTFLEAANQSVEIHLKNDDTKGAISCLKSFKGSVEYYKKKMDRSYAKECKKVIDKMDERIKQLKEN